MHEALANEPDTSEPVCNLTNSLQIRCVIGVKTVLLCFILQDYWGHIVWMYYLDTTNFCLGLYYSWRALAWAHKTLCYPWPRQCECIYRPFVICVFVNTGQNTHGHTYSFPLCRSLSPSIALLSLWLLARMTIARLAFGLYFVSSFVLSCLCTLKDAHSWLKEHQGAGVGVGGGGVEAEASIYLNTLIPERGKGRVNWNPKVHVF